MEGNRLSEVRQITVWVMLWMVSMTLFSLVGFDASGLPFREKQSGNGCTLTRLLFGGQDVFCWYFSL